MTPNGQDPSASEGRSGNNLIATAFNLLILSGTSYTRHGYGPGFFSRQWNGFIPLFIPLSGPALIGFLFAILAYTKLSSQLLTIYLIVAFLLALLHQFISFVKEWIRDRAATPPEEDPSHLSTYSGTPWLHHLLRLVWIPLWFTRGVVEPALFGGLGYFLLRYDPSMGVWLCLTGITLLLKETFIRAGEKERQRQMKDQRILAAIHSQQANRPTSTSPSPVTIHRRR